MEAEGGQHTHAALTLRLLGSYAPQQAVTPRHPDSDRHVEVTSTTDVRLSLSNLVMMHHDMHADCCTAMAPFAIRHGNKTG